MKRRSFFGALVGLFFKRSPVATAVPYQSVVMLRRFPDIDLGASANGPNRSDGVHYSTTGYAEWNSWSKVTADLQ